MKDEYTTIVSPTIGEFKDKGSKFFAYAFPVYTQEDIQKAQEQVRKEHIKARHHCFAWRIGTDGNQFRANDDGEPSGTAGRPILNAIEYADLTNVVALVLRWFGGIKLGTGGLCRAYGGVTSNCLKQLVYSEIKEMTELELLVPFEFSNSVYQMINRESLDKVFEEYESEGLRLKLIFEKKNSQTFKDLFTEISRGHISFRDSK